MALEWNFQRGGGGFKLKTLPWEEYGYFLDQHIIKKLMCPKMETSVFSDV